MFAKQFVLACKEYNPKNNQVLFTCFISLSSVYSLPHGKTVSVGSMQAGLLRRRPDPSCQKQEFSLKMERWAKLTFIPSPRDKGSCIDTFHLGRLLKL